MITLGALFILPAIAMALAAADHPAFALSFVIETVDSYDDVGSHASLKIDSQSNPHISYFRNIGRGHLKYATRSGAVWTTETIDRSGGTYTSLALSGGDVYIAYYASSTGDLRLAHKSGTTWSTETVDATGDVGQFASLAIDASGDLHASYYDATNGDLRYATKSAGVWQIQTVDGATSIVGQYTSIAVGYGDVWISYRDVTSHRLKVARRHTGTWSKVVVDAADVNETSMGIAAGDSLGSVSYYVSGSKDLRFAHSLGSSWSSNVVARTGYVGRFSSLFVDPKGTPRISYYDATAKDLRYAGSSSPGGGYWVITTPDAGRDAGAYSSMVLDDQYLAHIAYQDKNTGGKDGNLKFVSDSPTNGWVPMVVDDGGDDVGRSSSIGSLGVPFIAYYDATLKDLRYAERVAGVWSRDVVDDAGDVGRDCAVAQSLRGKIAYYDATNGDLKWASGSIQNGWTLQTIASTGDVGLFPAVTDSSGLARVGFYDATATSGSDALRYAAEYPTGWWVPSFPEEGFLEAKGGARPAITGRIGGVEVDAAVSMSDVTSYDVVNQDLWLETQTYGKWFPVWVDTTGDVGRYSAIQDRNNVMQIVWYDSTNGDLKYISGYWGLGFGPAEIVDSQGDVGRYCAMVLDDNDEPRVSYYDATNGDLKYAHRHGGVWGTYRVDGVGDVGRYSSITLGEAASPRICYYDAGNGDLKFAYADSGTGGPCPEPPCFSAGRGADAGSGNIEVGSEGGVQCAGEPLKLRLGLGTTRSVRLQVLDVEGRRVGKDEQFEFAAGGSQTVQWGAGRLKPGIYFVRAVAASGEEGRTKVVILGCAK